MAIKGITDIYRGYFQKSKVFLHPALGHKRGTSVTPIETYLSWGDISVNDIKLICLYHIRNDDEFRNFEEKCLYGHRLFEEYQEVEDGKSVYIFNFEEHRDDFINTVKGNYSLLSQDLKNKIRAFYGASSNNYAFIDGYLYPEEHYDTYAEILSPQTRYINQMKDILKETRELCSKPDFSKETLKMSVKSFDLNNL